MGFLSSWCYFKNAPVTVPYFLQQNPIFHLDHANLLHQLSSSCPFVTFKLPFFCGQISLLIFHSVKNKDHVWDLLGRRLGQLPSLWMDLRPLRHEIKDACYSIYQEGLENKLSFKIFYVWTSKICEFIGNIQHHLKISRPASRKFLTSIWKILHISSDWLLLMEGILPLIIIINSLFYILWTPEEYPYETLTRKVVKIRKI